MQSARVLNSGGPPKVMVCAMGFRSAIDFRWCLAANACVTVTESASWAEDGLSISSVLGSLALRAASTWAVVAAVLVGSTEVVSSAPLYSGMIVTAPFLICG